MPLSSFSHGWFAKRAPLLGTLWVAWVVAAVSLSAIGLSFGVMTISSAHCFGCSDSPPSAPIFPSITQLEYEAHTAGIRLVDVEVIFATAVGMLVYSEQLAFIGWLGGALVVVGLLYPLTNRGL